MCAGIPFCFELEDALLCAGTTFRGARPPVCADTSGSGLPAAGSAGVQMPADSLLSLLGTTQEGAWVSQGCCAWFL